MGERTLHQSLRRGMTVLIQQSLLQRAAVDADADGDLAILAHIHNSLDPILPADVAGVDADLAGTALCRRNGQLIVKMNIRHKWQGAVLANFSKTPGAFHIRHRQTDDLTARFVELADLIQTPLYIGGLGIEHGLDGHRRTAANGDAAYHYLSCHIFHPLKMLKISLNMISAMNPEQYHHPRSMEVGFVLGIEFLVGDALDDRSQDHSQCTTAVQRRDGRQVHHRQIHPDKAAEIQDVPHSGIKT